MQAADPTTNPESPLHLAPERDRYRALCEHLATRLCVLGRAIYVSEAYVQCGLTMPPLVYREVTGLDEPGPVAMPTPDTVLEGCDHAQGKGACGNCRPFGRWPWSGLAERWWSGVKR